MTQDASLTAARRLRLALDAVGDALAHTRLDDLLVAEGELAGAVANLSDAPPTNPAERDLLRRELGRVRTALTRCRELGVSLDEFARLSLEAQGVSDGYDRLGAHAHQPDTRRPGLEERV